jgi:hypothetical protein
LVGGMTFLGHRIWGLGVRVKMTADRGRQTENYASTLLRIYALTKINTEHTEIFLFVLTQNSRHTTHDIVVKIAVS